MLLVLGVLVCAPVLAKIQIVRGPLLDQTVLIPGAMLPRRHILLLVIPSLALLALLVPRGRHSALLLARVLGSILGHLL